MWDSVLWGGDSRYVPAVTALSVEYLLEGAHPRKPMRLVIQRGVDALVRMQGTFDLQPSAFDLYNQGIVTAVLLRAAGEGYAVPPSAIESGLARICKAQLPEGGWGWRAEDPVGQASVTAWQVRALTLAKGRQVPGVPQALARGTLWLGGQQSVEESTQRDRTLFAQRVMLATAPVAVLKNDF